MAMVDLVNTVVALLIQLVTSYGEGGCGSSDDCVGSGDDGGDIVLLWWFW